MRNEGKGAQEKLLNFLAHQFNSIYFVYVCVYMCVCVCVLG